MRRYVFILLLACIVSAVFAEKTVTFQSGVAPLADYTKCVDTTLVNDYPDLPFGDNRHLSIAAQGMPSYAALRFDISDYIPKTAQVDSAVLYLSPKLHTGIAEDASLFMISAPWKENEASWNVASSGVPWGSPGGTLLVTRRSEAVRITDDAHTWDITDLVQTWVKFPVRNHGMLLRSSDEDADFECWYYSTETERSELRPRLSITYRTAEEIEAAAVKAAEEAKVQAEKEKVETYAKREEEREEKLSAYKRPEEPWIVCEMAAMPIKQFREVADIPLYVREEARVSNTGVIRKLDPDPAPAAIRNKFGHAHNVRNVMRLKGENKDMHIRIRSNTYAYIDADNDGEFGPKEKMKLGRGGAGPFTVHYVYGTGTDKKVMYDYSFFIYPRNKDISSNDHWGVRHATRYFGAFNGIEIQLTDANDDWRMNSYGSDKLVIGGKESFLNKYMQINGKWWKVDVPPSGEFIAFAKPEDLDEEPVTIAALNLADFDGGDYKYKPEFIMLSCKDRDKAATYISDPKNKVLLLPQGTYKFSYGRAVSRMKKEQLIIDGKDMPLIDLTERREYTLKWGFPMSLNFSPVRTGQTISLKGDYSTPISIKGIEGARYRIEGVSKVLIAPPKVEFIYNNRTETTKQMQANADGGYNTLKVTLKQAGKYIIRLKGKSTLFGEMTGEVSK